MKIILCDDDKFILQLVQEQLKQLTIEKLTEIQIACATTDSSELLQYMKQNEGSYLLFLDLDFGAGRLNGIDVAKAAKNICPNAKIVFLTNHEEMAMKVLTSGVEPFGFLEKGTDMKTLRYKLFHYIQMASTVFDPDEDKIEKIHLITGIDEVVSVEKEKILYLESEKSISHGITYHTLDGSNITVRSTIVECQELLKEPFIRVHRSYLVNKRYMVALHGNMIRLSNGEDVPCAVRMMGEVKKCMQ